MVEDSDPNLTLPVEENETWDWWQKIKGDNFLNFSYYSIVFCYLHSKRETSLFSDNANVG